MSRRPERPTSTGREGSPIDACRQRYVLRVRRTVTQLTVVGRFFNVASLDLGELAPQPPDGLRVDLTYPRLGDSKNLADLCEREPFKVIEGDHDLLSLGKRVDRRGEEPSRLLALDAGGWVPALVRERVDQRDLLAAIAADRD